MSSHTSLGAAADQRKARLAALKNLKRKAPSDETPESTPQSPRRPSSPQPSSTNTLQAPEQTDNASPPADEIAAQYLSGRNYDPTTAGPKLGFLENPAAHQKTLEAQAAEVEAETRRKAAEEGEGEVDIFKLAPKKANWDLKRDLEIKMRVLDRRTENAIARIVRERIAGEKERKLGNGAGRGSGGQGEEIGMEGVDLVEGARLREEEEKKEEERERADVEMV